MEQVRAGQSAVSPTFISDYLNAHGTHGEVRVNTGAWNTGWHDGHDFMQWTGSERQQATLRAVRELSAAIQKADRQAAARGIADDEGFRRDLEEATWHLLRAETSCNFYWGEAWVHRADADMAVSWEALNRLRARLG